MNIRPEQPVDQPAVYALNSTAFPTAVEASLVDALRQQANPLVSLVAVVQDAVVGHILFSPVTLQAHPELKLMGLAPMSVLPAQQRKGIGSALVHAGLAACRQAEVGAVVVLGHPEFYPRFGFRPASQAGIGCEYDVPDEAFMLLELQPGYLKNASGTLQYHQAFQDL